MQTSAVKLLWAFFALSITAQAQYKLQGSVRDQTNKAVSFSNVLLLNAKDSSLVKGAVATETGIFIFENIKTGRFLLSASMIGYEKNYSTAFETTQLDKQALILILKEETKNLKEVNIVAKKPLFEQQIDKLVINVSSSITAAGGSAMEVLERSPGVTVNRQGNSLTMSGKTGVMVMINGKITRMPMDAVIQMLDGMSASNIEKIELITSPPAGYDAEGDAGFINIITKRNLNYGTNGTLSATWGQGRYFRPVAALTLNYRNQKLNLYGDYSYTNNHTWGNWQFDRTTEMAGIPTSTQITSDRVAAWPSHFSKVGFDYSLSTRTTLSGLLSVFDTRSTVNAPNTSLTYQNDILINKSILKLYEINHWQHLMLNLGLRHIFKNNQEWSIDIDKLYYYNDNPSNYKNDNQDIKNSMNSQSQFKIDKITPVQMWVAKTDYLAAISKKTRLSMGIKASLTDLDNKIHLNRFINNNWQEDLQFSQRYIFKEDIWAGYISLNSTPNPKTTLQAGLRYEHTATNVSDLEGNKIVNRRYGNFFPNASLSYKLSKIHTLNFAYSRRVSRPSYKDLAPYIIFLDQNTYFLGNSKLLPTISNAIQGSYVFKDTYIFSTRYSYDQNAIFRYQPNFNAANNQIYYYPENMKSIKTLAFTTSIPVSFTKWWQSQNNLTTYWQTLQTIYQGNPISRSIWNAQLNTSHSFALPHQFRMELTYFYLSPTLFGVTKSLVKSEVTFGIQKVLAHNKGSLRLNISDIFWKNFNGWHTLIPASKLDQYSLLRSEPRVVRLTYNLSFGNQKVKTAKTKATSSEEERQRL